MVLLFPKKSRKVRNLWILGILKNQVREVLGNLMLPAGAG